MEELKKEYNSYLSRHIRACAYLDDNSVPVSEREKWIGSYKEVLYHLNRILNEFEINNIQCTAEEILGGFEIEQLKKVG